jgi:hypothetical protein
MGRPRKFDYEVIRKMAMDGFTAQEIAAEVGAQSAEHIKVLVRKMKREIVQPVGRPPIARQKLDVGKVRALQRAGWSIGKIYYELGMMYPVEDIRKAMKKEENQK